MAFLGLAKAVPVGRGHEHPHGKKQVLRNGPELGDARIVRDRVSPALGRMFMAHLHRRALAFLGSGFGGSFRQRGGIGTASACEPAIPHSRRSKGQVSQVSPH